VAFLQRYPTLEQAGTAATEELPAFLGSLPRCPNSACAAERNSIRRQESQLKVDPVTTLVKSRLTQALIAQLLPEHRSASS
jgi:hypothetical protein